MKALIHLTLWGRNVYDNFTFQEVDLFETKVWWNQSILICDYIDGFVDGLKDILNANQIKSILINIYNETSQNYQPIEIIHLNFNSKVSLYYT